MNKNKDLEEKVLCLHQVFRPENEYFSYRAGCGDCRTCIPDESNKYCQRNIQIKVRIFYVKEK